MAPIIAVEMIRQLFKFGGSLRKEAIGIGAVTPAIVSVYGAMQAHCAEVDCTLQTAMFAVSGNQWAALIGSLVALTVHLYAKAKDLEE